MSSADSGTNAPSTRCNQVEHSDSQSDRIYVWRPPFDAPPTSYSPIYGVTLDLVVRSLCIGTDSRTNYIDSLTTEAPAPSQISKPQQQILYEKMLERQASEKSKVSAEERIDLDSNGDCSYVARAPFSICRLTPHIKFARSTLQKDSLLASETDKQRVLSNASRAAENPKSAHIESNGAPSGVPMLNLEAPNSCQSRSNLYRCHFKGCSKNFNKKVNLEAHLRTHTGEKPFACDWLFCGQRFAQKKTLEQHIRTHTGEKRFACHVCNKKFAQDATLAKHMYTHFGEKTLACDECGKKFEQRQTLRQHMKIHTGAKPFACEWPNCDRRFARKENLQEHARTHNGDISFVCETCGEIFSRIRNFRRHEKIHTGEKKHACTRCDWKFARSDSLKTHMKKIHGIS